MTVAAIPLWDGASKRTGSIFGDRRIFDRDTSADITHTSFVRAGQTRYFLDSVLPVWDEALSRQVPDPAIESAVASARISSQSPQFTIRIDGERLFDHAVSWLTKSSPSTAGAYD